MRHFAIIDAGSEFDVKNNILNMIPEDSEVTFFTGNLPKTIDEMDVKVVAFPEDCTEDAKRRNFISRYYKDSGTTGFLHVVSGSVQIIKNPIEFLDEIEKMMKAMKTGSWFNCSCDQVNYVYSKFNPRFTLEIDDDECIGKYDRKINLCSNANTVWIAYDLDNISIDQMLFDEKFTIPMFYIIEFLARRRNTKKPGEFYYMNMYPTVDCELGVFRNISSSNEKSEKDERETMVKEDGIFKSMNVDYHPDSDIVQISEDLRNILVC